MSLALEQKAILGEGLLWHDASQSWWWTDIESSSIHRWEGGSSSPSNFKLADRVGSFAHCLSGRTLLGMAKWLCIATDTTALESTATPQMQVQRLIAVDPIEPRTRINDGRTDRHGNFVFGTMNEAAEKRPIASFYQYSLHHGLRRLALPAVAIANSICFSLNGRTMYFSDTLTRCIMQCDYDADTAQVSNVRNFVEVGDTENGLAAYPDGSVIDRTGCLWNAQWGASQIVQYSPDGKIIQTISVPVKNPTCPAFGGPQLDILMVTSSRQDMSAQELAATPHAGSIFEIVMPGPTGVAATLFNDLIGYDGGLLKGTKASNTILKCAKRSY
jgi:sugar lactone lactonase YvrE